MDQQSERPRDVPKDGEEIMLVSLYSSECQKLFEEVTSSLQNQQQQPSPSATAVPGSLRNSFPTSSRYAHSSSSSSECDNDNTDTSQSYRQKNTTISNTNDSDDYGSSSSSSPSLGEKEDESGLGADELDDGEVGLPPLIPDRSHEGDHGRNNDSNATIDDNESIIPRNQHLIVENYKNINKAKIKKRSKEHMNQRQRIMLVQRLFHNLHCCAFPLPSSQDSRLDDLHIPICLLPKDLRHGKTPWEQMVYFRSLGRELWGSKGGENAPKPVLVLLARSGRFAGAVFVENTCLHHRTSTRYTVRRGQGKAQSSQDSQRRAKSMGAQLRRAGEIELQNDITTTLMEWKWYIQQAALILISCPKTMKKCFFEGMDEIWTKSDARVRRVPLDMGRPTYANVCLVHDVLMSVGVSSSVAPTYFREDAIYNDQKISNIQSVECAGSGTEDAVIATSDKPFPGLEEEVSPLLGIHTAARDGDVSALQSILDEGTVDVNQVAGVGWMTALHFAAESTNNGIDANIAANIVQLLLETGHANPCIVDARNRPPYFLASQEKVRDAFRMARATLGEDFCRWDEGAKVGPPLTEADLKARKDKETEKRRKKKAKQKEKRAKEKALTEDAQRQLQEEEERRKQEEEAKRIRDGLQPRSTAADNVCDFCQTICKGRRRNQMFKYLDYSYCSTDCVQKHKRELMAAAAMSRFGATRS